MTQTQDIVIPRGQNVGRTIISTLKRKLLFKKVDIITFDVKRDVVNKTITASITYKYN